MVWLTKCAVLVLFSAFWLEAIATCSDAWFSAVVIRT
jgi:hypothetical protein